MGEHTITIEGVNLVEFFGVNNAKFDILRRAFPQLKLVNRGNTIKVAGSEEQIKLFEDKVNAFLEFLYAYGSASIVNLEEILAGTAPSNLPAEHNKDLILFGPYGNAIKARTPNQKRMVHQVEDNDIVFAIGPAGTGKTYTAVALAVRALKNKLIKKIVLTRPAVEAGENLGFLPGDLKEKVDPYLRPLYDALDDMIPIPKLNEYMVNRVIEIAPLAFMRGRTIDNAFIILDEAQNATNLQLKMFLTRLGPSAKCIITGDLTQIDLPKNQKSGLEKAIRILTDIKGIGIVTLNEEDVIRHRLVKKIIKAYEKVELEEKADRERRKDFFSSADKSQGADNP
ncbi:PhoH family protein [Sphingobacteriales bacterium UPWRP_1]|nr:phosphate starvation-inducible protein PhoH [Sphingobacteriales bacterium TSM_CSM]PSJ72874.1 PhoH family protein [Sphingobacteriales bacterium UPWRP_1]